MSDNKWDWCEMGFVVGSFSGLEGRSLRLRYIFRHCGSKQYASIPPRKWNGFLRGLSCLRVTETTKRSGELSHIKKKWRNPMLFQERGKDVIDRKSGHWVGWIWRRVEREHFLWKGSLIEPRKIIQILSWIGANEISSEKLVPVA